jgi:hypothetical protein
LVFDSGGITIEKGREKKEGGRRGGEERRGEGTFTIHLYSLFYEQFVVQNIKNNLLAALNMRHT